MSTTFIEFIFTKIGSADCKGPGVAGNTSCLMPHDPFLQN